jgi:acetyl esterase
MASRQWVTPLSCLCAASVAAAGVNIEVRRDIEYARIGETRLALDAAIPQGARAVPAVIVVHGGGWVRGDRALDVAPLLQPLSDAGFAWFSISYRHMNDISQFGAGVEDVEAAIRFVKAHASEFRIDPDRMALVGESAGGHLAAMAALNEDPATRVKAVVALYAPTDLAAIAKTSRQVPQWIRDNLQGTPFEQIILARLTEMSPIEHVRRDMPPFLLIHGTADTLVPFDQSRAMCERMKSAGASCELYPVKGAGHGVRWWESSPALAEPYKREMVRWLKERLS